MPRAPIYEGNQVGLAQTTGARVRASDQSGVGAAFADGLVKLGNVGANIAEQQDRINAEFDDTMARKLAIEYQIAGGKIVSDYGQLEGVNALAARVDTDKALEKTRDDVYGRATNPRQRAALEERVSLYHASYAEKVGEGTARELKKERKLTFNSQIALSGETASASWEKPDLLQAHINTGLSVINDLGASEGWSAAALASERFKFESDVHKNVVDQQLAAGDIDVAEAYLDAHADKIGVADELALRRDLKPHLEQREYALGFAQAVGSAAPVLVDGSPTVSNDKLFEALIIQESGGRAGVKGPQTQYGQALGMTQMLPATARDMARKLGVPYQEELLTGTSKEAANYQRKLGRAYFDEGLKKYNGDIEKALKFYHGGPNERIWGPKTREYAKSILARAGGAQQSAKRWDLESVYSSIDRQADKEGWSLGKREGVKSYADKQVARDEKLIDRQEDQAGRDASEVVLSLGDSFTDISKIPRAIRDRMNPSLVSSYTERAKANAAPKEVKGNGSVVQSLNVMQILEPEKFAQSVNLGEYVGKMTAAEMDTLRTQQAKLIKEGATGPTVALNNNITSSISLYGGGTLGYDKRKTADENARYLQMHSTMRDDLMRVTGGKREPTEAEAAAAFDRAALRIGKEQGQTVGEALGSRGTVPNNVYQRIKSALTKNGVDATPARIAQDYFKFKGQAGYW